MFDTQLNAFGPSKFVGLRDISLARYSEAKEHAALAGRLSGFDGHTSREAVERATGLAFLPFPELAIRLQEWAEDLLGEDILGRVDKDKWQFLTIPTSARPRAGASTGPRPSAAVQRALDEAIAAARDVAAFPAPRAESDTRRRAIADIVRRRGQPRFRRMVLAAYGGRCAVTGCDVVDAVEAAHLIGYNGDATNHPTNGVPMRADLHTLFDLGLVWIDPDDMSVKLDASIRVSHYGVYHGRQLILPDDPSLHPSKIALKTRMRLLTKESDTGTQ